MYLLYMGARGGTRGRLAAKILVELALALALANLGCAAALRGSSPGDREGEAPIVGPKGVTRGRFLVATEQVRGAVFGRSVVVILDYAADGALGVVINKPLTLELRALLPDVAELRERDDVVHMGGPVAPTRMTLLIRADESVPSAIPVSDDLVVSGDPETLRSLLEARVPHERFHAYLGHAGWAAGQLDAEIARGDWKVVTADAELIFGADKAAIWPALIRAHGGLQVRLAPSERSR